MRQALLFVFPLILFAQPGYQALEKGYAALRSNNYEEAIRFFEIAVAADTGRAAIRKDLAYTYLKVGRSEAARAQFRQAMELDPSDQTVALEFAFLCYETRTEPLASKALARRIFDALRRRGSIVAEEAFQNIDRPLVEGIARWNRALEISPEMFSVHYELAQLAEQRDDLPKARSHYLEAWRLRTNRKATLIDVARVDLALDKPEEAMAALLAASRGGEPRAAESARELLPERYPYVYEFRGALKLDPENSALHRELAYLLLAMNDSLAEAEFLEVARIHPDDLVAAAQLGLLLMARQDRNGAMPFLDRVLAGDNSELAARIRAAIQPNLMARRSLEAGFYKDALRYLKIANEADPLDYEVALKLGWTNNMLHDDRTALHWFDIARRSPDGSISSEAARAYQNLRPTVALFRTTAWILPFYSSRWNDVFAYGQIKSELNWSRPWFRPYVSTRLIADLRPDGKAQPLSERSFIVAAGVSAKWNRLTGWAEAGSAISYFHGSMLPDYRGGVSWSRSWTTESGRFLEINADEVFLSRFGNDWLSYFQSRVGYRFVFVSANVTGDSGRQHWANFVETGPGVRFHVPNTPGALRFSASFLRGIYLLNDGVPKHSNFNDLRLGFWYAITK